MSRGRKSGFQMSNEHRLKIQNSNILKALISHVEGKLDMSSTQVTAGLGLLKKVLPDLAASAQVDGDGDLVSLGKMTDAELEAIAAASRSGATETTPSKSQLN